MFISALLILTLAACNVEPDPIHYGEDNCVHCQMTIMDHRYGTEMVTSKGKVFKFDSIECLVEFMDEKSSAGEEFELILVTPFDQPGRLVDARQSHYLHSRNLPSPMGMYLSAFETEATAMQFKALYDGKVYKWDSLVQNFKLLRSLGM
jgi:copper chaperone NosL